MHGVEEPEAGVDGVVLGAGAGIRESIRQKPVVHRAGKGRKDVPRDAESAGRQTETRKRDHRIPAPVGEPVIPGDNGGARNAITFFDNELRRSEGEDSRSGDVSGLICASSIS